MRTSATLGSGRLVAGLLSVASLFGAAPIALAAGPAPIAVDQGKDWTPASRREFYSRDQGSRIMPLRWMRALRQPDGSPFMADGLRRYGFLANTASPHKLPVGFTAAGQPGSEMIGMTCAACHTRQIEVGGKAYRIDGGPAIIDFQTFLSDIDAAVDKVLDDAAVFAKFAQAVLGKASAPGDVTTLRWGVSYWHLRNHTLMAKSLPKDNPWGPGEFDAIAMIFNRLTGLDLGPPPTYLIKANIRRADAPTRYPFLWNAAKQDRTQWPGFAPNDSEDLRLLRNVGQVLGVFADFHPKKDISMPSGIDFWSINSINIAGLKRLENLMRQIGPPRWPWPLDEALAARGSKVYDEHCDHCHKAKPGPEPWKTPVEDANTDVRELELMERRAESGVLEGVLGLGREDSAFFILALTGLSILNSGPGPTATSRAATMFRTTFRLEKKGYEARVLHGVWAAAPYLHNGSVSTLAELLKPDAARRPSFKVGPAYDPIEVGLANEQTQFSFTLKTTDCSDPGSGNSRCGHNYGTPLPEADKRALLEFLKKL